MQVKLDRRWKNNFLITNSYTLGKGMSYGNGDSNGDISTPADIELSWGRTVNDRKHTFVSSFVYGLPFQKEGVLGWIVNGWQFSGFFTAQSGQALDIRANGTTLRAPGNTQRANKNGDAEILGGVGNGEFWFDTSVFTLPAPDTFGNMSPRRRRHQQAGLPEPRCVDRQEVRVRQPLSRVPRRCVQCDELVASEQSERQPADAGQRAVRADHGGVRPASRPVRPAVHLLSRTFARGRPAVPPPTFPSLRARSPAPGSNGLTNCGMIA